MMEDPDRRTLPEAEPSGAQSTTSYDIMFMYSETFDDIPPGPAYFLIIHFNKPPVLDEWTPRERRECFEKKVTWAANMHTKIHLTCPSSYERHRVQLLGFLHTLNLSAWSTPWRHYRCFLHTTKLHRTCCLASAWSCVFFSQPEAHTATWSLPSEGLTTRPDLPYSPRADYLEIPTASPRRTP